MALDPIRAPHNESMPHRVEAGSAETSRLIYAETSELDENSVELKQEKKLIPETLPENERIEKNDIQPGIIKDIEENGQVNKEQTETDVVKDNPNTMKLTFMQVVSDFFIDIKRKFYALEDSNMTTENFGNLYYYILERKKIVQAMSKENKF